MNETLNRTDWRKPRANTIPIWFWIVGGVIVTCLVVGPIALFIYATTDHPVAPPLHIGDVDVDRIVVERSSGEGRQRVVISDTATIERLRLFVDSLDSGWYVSPDETPRQPDRYVALENGNNTVARFSLCGSLIIYGEGTKRPLSDEEWARLQSILALEQETPADKSIQDTPRE